MTTPGNAEVVMNENAVAQQGSGAAKRGFSGSLPSEVPPAPSKIRNGRFERWHLAPETVPEEDGWFLTYLDVITLMLVMMVVMLSFSGSGQQGPASSAASKAAPSVLPSSPVPFIGGPGMASPIPLPVPSANSGPESEIAPEPDLLASLALDHLDKNIEVIVSKGAVSFRISSEILFGSGRAELEDAGLDVIDRLVPTLAAGRYRIIVEGHTDNLPIQTERFPSNWELSASRASSVVRYLQLADIKATRLSATGYADTRPIADNADERGRASNRRVELVMRTEPDKP